ncbi:SDR family oxidoreductase [Phanerochaete sordida]|uniref:SDR family oxidoreductase n=1 Tax=Phanerochaete sordida TaxID=48140 RepID=A0A9P3LEM3_9APHY|nr:SDR family oxidoreductase [Phanerochaete sordida]
MHSARIWLVTGSSSGFGLAMCKLALAKGDKVIATLRRPSDLDELSSQYPPDVLLVLKVDVTHTEDVISAFRIAKERFGRVDVVFNNAASFIVGEVEGVPDAEARRVMEVVFWGATTVSKEAVRFFREENPPGAGGLLLNISSDGGHSSFPAVGYYIAAKHALEGLTETFARELDPGWNIKICLITPGVFRTEIKSKSPSVPVHAAYEHVGSVQQSRKFLDMYWDPSKPVRVGDVEKAVGKIYELSLLERPPMRLFLGKDCLERVGQQLQQVGEDLRSSAPWSQDLLEDE